MTKSQFLLKNNICKSGENQKKDLFCEQYNRFLAGIELVESPDIPDIEDILDIDADLNTVGFTTCSIIIIIIINIIVIIIINIIVYIFKIISTKTKYF